MKQKRIVSFMVFVLLLAAGIFLFLPWKPLLKPLRQMASDPSEAGLTEGQRDKKKLIESLHFSTDPESLLLTTEFLPNLCLTATELEVIFAAKDFAIDGEAPTISHIFFCEKLGQNLADGSLRVEWSDFLSMHKNNEAPTENGELKSKLIFAQEKFPARWYLSEIQVRGTSNFSVTEPEFTKILGQLFEFESPTTE